MERTEYNSFMTKYNLKHAYCPKCGGTAYVTTLMGYVLNLDRPDDYKDLNIATCYGCGDKHTVHERLEEKI